MKNGAPASVVNGPKDGVLSERGSRDPRSGIQVHLRQAACPMRSLQTRVRDERLPLLRAPLQAMQTLYPT